MTCMTHRREILSEHELRTQLFGHLTRVAELAELVGADSAMFVDDLRQLGEATDTVFHIAWIRNPMTRSMFERQCAEQIEQLLFSDHSETTTGQLH